MGEDLGDLPVGAEVGDAGVAGVVGDGGGDVPEFDVAVLGVPAEQRERLVFVESVGDHQGALGLFDGGPGCGGQLDRHPGGGLNVTVQGIGDVDEIAADLDDLSVRVADAFADGDDGVDSSLRVQDAVPGAERSPGGDRGGDHLAGPGPVVGMLMSANERRGGDYLTGGGYVHGVDARGPQPGTGRHVVAEPADGLGVGTG